MVDSNITLDEVKELLTKDCTTILMLPGVIDTLHTLANETARLGNEVEIQTLSAFDYYKGQLNGLEMALALLDRLPMPTKRPSTIINEEEEDPIVIDYFCSVCGEDEIDIDDYYCPHCGGLFVKE